MTPNFDRDVYCLLGLPFDALSEDATVRKLQDATQRRESCFLSTPNLNFAIAAQTDAAFRDSVLHSDLSVADGMPLVWMARLLGLPLPQRVAGSTLFERLDRSGGTPIKVFFFGGPDGIAARACGKLNARPSALKCVGFDAPGFGSVESMSSDERIDRINASGAEFVVVSLGARKGQAWIERNRGRLQAPVISHLGAVVNFVAGTVARAPRWMQRAGIEWLWRVKEEPALWRRYAVDAKNLFRLLTTRIIPYALTSRIHRPTRQQLAAARLDIVHDARATKLRLHGAWSSGNLAPLRMACFDVVRRGVAVDVDLADVTHLDAAAVALLSLLRLHCADAARAYRVGSVPIAMRRVFRGCCADYLLEGIDERPA